MLTASGLVVIDVQFQTPTGAGQAEYFEPVLIWILYEIRNTNLIGPRRNQTSKSGPNLPQICLLCTLLLKSCLRVKLIMCYQKKKRWSWALVLLAVWLPWHSPSVAGVSIFTNVVQVCFFFLSLFTIRAFCLLSFHIRFSVV